MYYRYSKGILKLIMINAYIYVLQLILIVLIFTDNSQKYMKDLNFDLADVSYVEVKELHVHVLNHTGALPSGF